uniref:Uncharacterized protein n=1 Tax=Rhizophora mucronata TaxID=61149 RepID=A0A2P2IXA7_RHIMU
MVLQLGRGTNEGYSIFLRVSVCFALPFLFLFYKQEIYLLLLRSM